MTHVGEEFAFGAIGGLCGLFGMPALDNFSLQASVMVIDNFAETTAFHHSSEHSANLRHQLQEGSIRGQRRIGKELQNGYKVTAGYNRKGEARAYTSNSCNFGSGEIGVLRKIEDQGRLSGGEYPPRQLDSGIELRGFGYSLECSSTFGV